ncbi:MAG: FHA domain-containing protein [Anaerolineaceae bacterium]
MECPHCKASIRAGARFCPSCGQSIVPPAPVPAPATIKASSQGAQPVQKLPANQPRLIIREGQVERTVLLSQQPLAIGRDPAADIQIGLASQQNPVGLPDISRHHARISPSNGGYAIEDLGSRNGTFLRGRQIPSNVVVPLQNGDVIRIGDIYGNSVSLTYLETKDVSQAITTAFNIDMAMISSMPVATIGRDPQSAIPLNASIVSWKHAQFVRTASGHDMVDVGSTNGTFVNGKRIKSVSLKVGDVIQIGPFKMVYGQAAIVASAGSLRLDGISLRREVKTKKGAKVILNDVSLTILPREFVALVGGSGAGKSTLMDALNGSRRASQGRVLINGDDLYRHFDAYRRDMGYVPQADILHTSLTVQNALKYTAMLRLPPDTSRKEIQHRIDDTLDMVDMTEQKDVQISQLSGGQRKRVSIASEMLSEPRLLFLDEPTSGLDPGLDKKMMRTLNNLADSGCTVLVTTHATSNILDSCDQVVFLSHGELVYFGPPQKAITYFQTPDFATIYAKVDTKKEADQFATSYKHSTDYRQYIADRQVDIPKPSGSVTNAKHKKHASLATNFRQFFILTRRYIDLIFNDKMSLFILSAVMPIIGIFLLIIAGTNDLIGNTEREIFHIIQDEGSYSIAPDAQRLLFMFALSAILLGLFAAAYEVVKERVVYERERMINLGIIPYILSKVTVLMSFGVLQCVALLLVVGFKVSYPDNGVMTSAILEIYITLLLAMLAAIGMGLLISTMVRSSNTVIYVILVVLFVQIIFSGVLFPLPEVAKPISYLTPTRWTMEALGSTIDMNHLNNMGGILIEEFDEQIESKMDFNINYDRTAGHLWSTWGVLAGFGLVSIILAMFFLKAQDKK